MFEEQQGGPHGWGGGDEGRWREMKTERLWGQAMGALAGHERL